MNHRLVKKQECGGQHRGNTVDQAIACDPNNPHGNTGPSKAAPLLTQLPVNAGEGRMTLSPRAPDTHMGDPVGVFYGPWLQAGIPAFIVIIEG